VGLVDIFELGGNSVGVEKNAAFLMMDHMYVLLQ
jgi:hypothetical protein